MTATWPSTLPQRFLSDSFAEESADNLIVSNMSVGPAKMRRRTTAAVRPISGSMYVTAEQLATLRAFIGNDIADRALPFTFPDQRGGPALHVRMTAPISISAMGLEWRVGIALEVLP